jgi:hypothetical protein
MDVFELCVLLILCLCMFASFYAYLLYVAYVIAYQVRNLREWRNEFQLFLYLGQEIPASSAVEYLRIECVEEAKWLNFCSLFPRVGFELFEPCRWVQVGRGVSVASLRRDGRSCCKRECIGPRRTSSLGEWLKVEECAECVKFLWGSQRDKAQEG